MDFYWAYVLESEYLKQINLKTKKETENTETKTKTVIRDIHCNTCNICGQNKYWCVCDTLEYTKFDCDNNLKTNDYINNNAKSTEQEQTTFRDHQKTQNPQ